MKIRIGFVSNSSTTSFLVFGFDTNKDLLKKIYEQVLNEEMDPKMSVYDIVDTMEGPLKERGFEMNLCGEDGTDFYGISVHSSIKKEEILKYMEKIENFKKEFDIEKDWYLYHVAYSDQ